MIGQILGDAGLLVSLLSGLLGALLGAWIGARSSAKLERERQLVELYARVFASFNELLRDRTPANLAALSAAISGAMLVCSKQSEAILAELERTVIFQEFDGTVRQGLMRELRESAQRDLKTFHRLA